MKVGTKSLLFGIHQIFLHPFFVFIGWVWLFGLPTIGEFIAIIIHDWGYYGVSNMDEGDGNSHPKWAGNFFRKKGRKDLALLCEGHSRFYAKENGIKLSKLCYADKIGNAFMPIVLWALLARLTGEYKDYINTSKHEINNEYYNGDLYYWFRNYRFLVCKIIGEDLGKFERNA